jgi:uncharacterized protein (TIRG00374 family)
MKSAKTWIGILISAFFLYLAFRKTDWGQTWLMVKHADFIYLLMALPLLLLAFVLRAIRWKYLLHPTARLGFNALFGPMMIGFMALNILPLRLGEFIRAWILGRQEGISKSQVFATIVVERVFDGLTIMSFLVIVLFALTLEGNIMAWVKAFSYLALAIYIGAIVFLILVRFSTGFIVGVVRRLLGWAPTLEEKAEGMIRSFAEGLDAVRDPRLFAWISFYSIIIWLSYVAFYYVTMFGFQSPEGFNIGREVGFAGGMFVLVAIALGIMIPSSPGFVGTYELACITALTAMGVANSLAESYAIVTHAINFIPVTLIGIVYLYAHNVSLRDITDAHEKADPESAN